MRHDDASLILDEFVVTPGVPVDLQVEPSARAARGRGSNAPLSRGSGLAQRRARIRYQLVFQAGEKQSHRIALASARPALVSACCSRASGADDIQPPSAAIWCGALGTRKADVGATPGHLGGHRIAPPAPASATMAASCASFLALSTAHASLHG